MAKNITIQGKEYEKTYFSIFDYVKNVWTPDWEEIQDMTISELWDHMVADSELESEDDKESIKEAAKELVKLVGDSNLILKLNKESSILTIRKNLDFKEAAQEYGDSRNIKSVDYVLEIDFLEDEERADLIIEGAKNIDLFKKCLRESFEYIKEHFDRNVFNENDEHFEKDISSCAEHIWDIPLTIQKLSGEYSEPYVSGGYEITFIKDIK